MKTFAPELISRIAILMLSEGGFSPGPPSALLPLTLTCRSINHSLSLNHNSTLLAEVFRLGFDTFAISNRFPSHALSAIHYAEELKRRCKALRRIKAGCMSEDSLLDDLWVTYLMMLENDGRNAEQLSWAGIPSFLSNLLKTSARPGTFFQDPKRVSLVVWLIWLTSTYGMF